MTHGKAGSLQAVFLTLAAALLLGSCAADPPIPQSHIPPGKSNLDLQADSQVTQGRLSALRQTIVRAAVSSVGAPYRWGGTSPDSGFDCSGLVRYAYDRAGILVPRQSAHLYRQGRPVPFKDLLPGDMVFFSSPKEKKPIHVGIFIGRNQFIHAPGKGRTVKIAALDNPYFRRHYIGARTYLPTAPGPG